jgi:hypothetical protein
MNVEIGAEAALFPEKEYINGIAVAVYTKKCAKVQSLRKHLMTLCLIPTKFPLLL